MDIKEVSDVLVIGAGPAGTAAACTLQKMGKRVVIVDQHDFPRDKVCGDALIPDALHALSDLGLLDDVLSRAEVMQQIVVSAPSGADVQIEGRVAVLPRRILDDMLLQRAKEQGADFRPNLKFTEPLVENSRIVGGRFRNIISGEDISITAGWTVLATGAAAQPLKSAGIHLAGHTGIALRGYVSLPEGEVFNKFRITFLREICPGYGWIFPGPANTVNIGVGYFLDARRQPFSTNLNELWESFISGYPPAADLLVRGRLVGDLKGAPLRTGLHGSKLTRPGMLAIGEAIGTTYAFSGEGIGKALDSGIRAAKVISDTIDGLVTSAEQDYEREIKRAYLDQFDAYRIAQAWLSYPWLCNVLAAAANRSPALRLKLSHIFAEQASPKEIFSLSGIAKAMIRK